MTPTGLDGYYFEAGNSTSIPAQLSLSGHRCKVVPEGQEERLLDLEHINDRLAGVSRKVTFTDGSVFEARDSDGVDAMFGIHRSFFSRLIRVESSPRLVIGIALATLILLFGIFRYGLPVAAAGAAWATPDAVKSLIDDGVLKSVDTAFGDTSKLPQARQLDIKHQFDEMVSKADYHGPTPKLLFRSSKRLGPNAFALPGGSVVLLDALVKEAKHDDELLGVLGHELAHVELNHSLKQLYRVLGIGFMISVIGGDASQLLEDVIAQGAALEAMSYSRKFETQADQRAAQIMAKLGRDPYAFVNLLERITHDEGGKRKTGWWDSHPATGDRRKAVRQHLKSLGYDN